ncbi:hypothetical protein FACS1894187_15610 [Synergistales bacterium]|nr:hypothetical protein FACS1894187_15610 [Synergistales bacterium]
MKNRPAQAVRVALLVLLFLFVFLPEPLFALEQKRITVVLLPTENNTDIQIWRSKYYPYSVLEERTTEYFASLFADSPMVDVVILDENGMDRWFAQPYRTEDMAFQLEIYDGMFKDKANGLGSRSVGKVSLRLKAYDAVNAERFATRTAVGKDTRYTFNPDGEKLFWIDATVTSLPIPFKDGLDLLGLTQTQERGQKMSRPVWREFATTSHWQAIKNSVNNAWHEAMGQVSIALRRNDPEGWQRGEIAFNPYAIEIGRIISPTATSTRKKREYIISIGRENALQAGDLLDVIRSDTYITVDPENPVAVVPQRVGRARDNGVGKVKVLSVQERTAVVRVIKDNRKEPIQLNDLVMKFHGDKTFKMDWESVTP